jgi:undecaprenyl-diphosphatase
MFSAAFHLDRHVLDVLTVFMARHRAAHVLAYFGAEWLILLFPLALYSVWHWPADGRSEGSRAVAKSLAAAVLALVVKTVIRLAVQRPRPFLTDPALLHLNLSVDSLSFPSQHALFASAIACSLLLSGYLRLGWALVAGAVLIGFSRMMAGVHYPTDILGGFLVGGACAFLVQRYAGRLEQFLSKYGITYAHF